ncbi:hypothetical protein CXG81DRAFT_9272 [Caulochytrium protostelioides]|uniref:Metallo-beta-lactamase domain-containing protein n=1 Tax=Caulochytrium protostelioides TaxID=1555241 RepID=A0A4P9XDR5_9FUNG|nr:hypothetical protein CXG81DRAFT_9272 [Caulochytrium protostelioides]|eukprot:RKP03664.1 hypothetical protein CXG81DRAFT_9272 [Caulochytrium protostelioides]
MAITWIGQSTCVVQMGGKTLLTDPIFQMRTVDYIGPKRLRPPPCTLEALPPVDLVLVSHNHYDHLDAHVVDAYGDSVTWVVPLGLGPWFRARGVTNLVELDWWASARVAGLQIVATPAQHWSGRHFFDVNASLWCSFLVRDDQQTGASFFHCGDSGYCPVFGEVRALFGDVTAAALPIGSYAPRWYMQHQHMDPREACCVHRDLGATLSIGVHWGTFLMSDEHFLRPPRELAEAAAAMNLPSDAVITTPFGRTVLVTMKQSSSANAEPQSDTISS